VTEVTAAEALGDVRRFGLGVPVHVKPATCIEAIGLDDQRVAVPLADRVPNKKVAWVWEDRFLSTAKLD
jgi:hypothetical protein